MFKKRLLKIEKVMSILQVLEDFLGLQDNLEIKISWEVQACLEDDKLGQMREKNLENKT